jgi:ABC-type uncharacterized transport system substrate-binding protein
MERAMKKTLPSLFVVFCLMAVGFGSPGRAFGKTRLAVVDSYHKEYLWSRHTNEGFCAAMLKYGYFDGPDQAAEFTDKGYVESSKAIVRKLWMDSKRKTNRESKAEITMQLTDIIRKFKPDLIFLGEDNAAEYIGRQFLDSGIPVVFWGVNNTPVKYGLVEGKQKPGHNVTGVYQSTHYAESIALLKKIVPGAKTFAVLSDDSTTGRIFSKSVQHLDRKGALQLKLIDTVNTNSFEEWKKRALELQEKVDAFFVAQYAALKDAAGVAVPDAETAAWYLSQIRIPEAVGFRHRVMEGMLCAADDSAYNQGYEAVAVAHDILASGADPAAYPPRTPRRGPLMVNVNRAGMLGIALTEEMGIEEYINDSSMASAKKRLLVVDSYHKGYNWSNDICKGFCAAMLKHGYFNNEKQVQDYKANGYVETSKAVIRKLWMNSKVKNSDGEMEEESRKIYKIAGDFSPDLVFLGDDNAARYVGGKLLDSDVPVVFWGLNNSPLKYGLVDSLDTPGHNVTGVYQTGYYRESLQLLKDLVPEAQTFALLSDGSATGRAILKSIQVQSHRDSLPLKLVETVSTSDYGLWKQEVLRLQGEVDAFFIAQYNALKNAEGDYVPNSEVASWYTAHVKVPEATMAGHFVRQGILCSAADSGYMQGFEAVGIANDILNREADPARYPPRSPRSGKLMVNLQRAESLGIALPEDIEIEEHIK